MRRNAAPAVSTPPSPSAAQSGPPRVSRLAVRGCCVGVVVGHVILAGAGRRGGVPVLLGRGRRAWSVPGDQHVLRLKPSMALLHRPDRYDDPAANPQNPRQLPNGSDPTLRGGDVVDDGHGEDGVKTVVLVGQSHVITDQNLIVLLSGDLGQVPAAVRSDVVNQGVAAEIFPTAAA